MLLASAGTAVRAAPPDSRRVVAATVHANGDAAASPGLPPASHDNAAPPTPLTPPVAAARRAAVIAGTDVTSGAAAEELPPAADSSAGSVASDDPDAVPGVLIAVLARATEDGSGGTGFALDAAGAGESLPLWAAVLLPESATARVPGRDAARLGAAAVTEPADDPSVALGPAEPADPVPSANAIGIAATAEPTPNATANAPTRPT